MIRPLLPAIGTPPCEVVKFLVPILNSLTLINEFTIKDSFSFAKKIVEQISSLFMSRLDVDSLFPYVSLEETITICIELIRNIINTVEGLSNSEFKKLLLLATKKSYFIFNESLSKQIDGAAMVSPLKPTFATAFLYFHKNVWLEQCPDNLNQFIIENM